MAILCCAIDDRQRSAQSATAARRCRNPDRRPSVGQWYVIVQCSLRIPEAARIGARLAAEPDFRQSRVKPVNPFASAIREFLFRRKHGTFAGRLPSEDRPALRFIGERAANKAGVPKSMWNRDYRAGAITEAQLAGSSIEDAARIAAHSGSSRTAQVYDRNTWDAARRVANPRRQYPTQFPLWNSPRTAKLTPRNTGNMAKSYRVLST
jgi:hypothetical protein